MDGKSIGKEQWIKLICIFIGSFFAVLVYKPIRAFVNGLLIDWGWCPSTPTGGFAINNSKDICFLWSLDYHFMIIILIFLEVFVFLVIYSAVMNVRKRKRVLNK